MRSCEILATARDEERLPETGLDSELGSRGRDHSSGCGPTSLKGPSVTCGLRSVTRLHRLQRGDLSALLDRRSIELPPDDDPGAPFQTLKLHETGVATGPKPARQPPEVELEST